MVFLGPSRPSAGVSPTPRNFIAWRRAPDSEWLARDEAFFNLGLLLRAERRYRDALTCFERAIELDPKYSDALEARADVLAALSVEVPNAHSAHWHQMLDTLLYAVPPRVMN